MGCKKNISFFLYCTACQHPAQNLGTQRHGQPAPMDILKVLTIRQFRQIRCYLPEHLQTVPANKVLFARTVPANNSILKDKHRFQLEKSKHYPSDYSTFYSFTKQEMKCDSVRHYIPNHPHSPYTENSWL